MNDLTMLDTLPGNGLIAHSTALEAAGLTLALVRRVSGKEAGTGTGTGTGGIQSLCDRHFEKT